MGSQLNRSTWSKRTAYMQKHSQELTLNVTVWSERIKSLVLRNLPLSESYKDAHLSYLTMDVLKHRGNLLNSKSALL